MRTSIGTASSPSEIASCCFARPLPIPSTDGCTATHSQLVRDDGVVPGWPEAFSTIDKRDAALGSYGYAHFIPTSWSEAEAAGFQLHQVAIGHPLGDPDFERLAPPVLDAVALQLIDGVGFVTVVIARVGYQIDWTGKWESFAITASPEFGVAADEVLIAATMVQLEAEFRERLT